jgi:hypothetical protein
MRWQEITLRAALIIGLLAAIAYDIDIWIAAPLGLLTIAVTAELAIRPYAASSIDRLLLGCGITITASILIGIGLNLTPWGLTRITLTIAWTIVNFGVLAWRRKLSTHIGKSVSGIISFGPWVLLASVILIAAGVLAVAGVRQWNRQPVLAFALISTSPDSVVVEIDSTSLSNRYRIVAASKSSGARQYSSAPLTVKSGRDGQRIFERVPINVAGVWTINLESVNDGTVVRWLKVDVHSS